MIEYEVPYHAQRPSAGREGIVMISINGLFVLVGDVQLLAYSSFDIRYLSFPPLTIDEGGGLQLED